MTALFTERLRLEPLRASDAARLLAPLQDPALYTYLPEDPPTAEVLQRRYDFWEGGLSPDGEERWLNWVVSLRSEETPIGTFQATIPMEGEGSFAYLVFPPFWRRGYARELARCVLSHLFERYAPPRLYAEIDTRNLASIALVESLALERVATTRDADFFKGASSDEHRYAISREAWARAHGVSTSSSPEPS